MLSALLVFHNYVIIIGDLTWNLISSYLCEDQLQDCPSELSLVISSYLWPFIPSLKHRVPFCVVLVGFVNQHCPYSGSEISSIIPTKVAIIMFNLLKVCQLSY